MLSECLCPVCSDVGQECFDAEVLGKHLARYFLCSNCGYLWIRDPYWLDEAYSEAIADTDTGIVSRNVDVASKLAPLLLWGLKERGRGKYLDSSGGYGLLVRLMRDYGFDFYWKDKYCKNIVATGFEYNVAVGQCRAVTAFEVLEHLENPVGYIRDALKLSGANTFIFSTELFDGVPPAPNDWWYYARPSGQHIGFFQKKTLERIANDLGMQFYSSCGIHVFSNALKDNLVLRLMMSRIGRLLAPILAKRILGSKTNSDSENIANLMSRKI